MVMYFSKKIRNPQTKRGKYINETIYLHKLIAERYIPKPDDKHRWFVRFKNSIPHDCRLSNLEWSTFSFWLETLKRLKIAQVIAE